MQPFENITATTSTPQVSFDPIEQTLHISGESYPENSFEFYGPINAWIKESLTLTDQINLNINISYMNSSSTKCMLDLLDLLEDAHKSGIRASITWAYDTENPRSLDLAEEFQEEVTLPFNIVAFQK